MTQRPFDPSELDQPLADADRAVAELEGYLADTAAGAPGNLERRVMAAVEQEPAPRRGVLAWLMPPGGSGGRTRGLARAGLLGATLVLAVAGALLAGQLADLVRNVGSESPTPVESVSPSSSGSVAPSPSTSPEETPSGSPDESAGAHQSPGPTGTPKASGDETPEASSDESGEESKTPRPSATASPSATPTQAP